MSTTGLSIHGCTDVVFAFHYPANANSVRLDILREGDKIEITMFNLPAEVVDKLINGLGEPKDKVTEVQAQQDADDMFDKPRGLSAAEEPCSAGVNS